MAEITISETVPRFIFINVWKTETRDNQQQLIATMKAELPAIQKQPGFVGMAINASLDGKEVVIYAQWQSETDFKRGISDNDAAMESRNNLSRFGSFSANTFTLDSILTAEVNCRTV